jgi:hypothetical protein
MTARPISISRVVAVVVGLMSVAGAYNVLGDNASLETEAASQACLGGRPRCAPALTRLLRTPFFQDLDFRASGRDVQLRCKRSLYLVGPYNCALRSPAAAAP